ncbi:MAG: signal peptidase I [Planctomycetes bacterium]|nr:signal peptidase I [Planctomycetota bacterium]
METTGGMAASGGIIAVIWLALFILIIASMWRVFTKAGQPGWGCIIPFYNIYLMLKIAGKPGWWLLLFFVPVVNLIISIVVIIALANSFGKGVGFAVGLLLLPLIFYPILAFGSAQYIGPQQAGDVI